MGVAMKKNIIKRVLSLFVVVLFALSLAVGCNTNSKGNDSSTQGTGTENAGQKDNKDLQGTVNQESKNNEGASEDGDQNQGANPDETKPEDQDGDGETTDIPDKSNVPSIRDMKVKALYLTGWTAGIDEKLQHFIELAKTTEINAYVVDIKDDDGLVSYKSNIPAVQEINGWTNKYNVEKVIKAFHDNGIPVIGRLVCFNDPYASSKRTEMAIKHVNGGLWRDPNKNQTWLNPYSEEAWKYIVDIAKEAVELGFDEIQFDYVRFPDGKRSTMNVGNPGIEKYEAINRFLEYARKEIPAEIPISADVFGIILESPGDTEDIGQYLELVGKDNVDVICPMVYPSHYAVGQIVNNVTFAKPDLDPYGVVYNSLVKGKTRIAAVEGYKAKVRPYLQDFTASWLDKGYYQEYGAEQVRQQKKAVYDAGYEEWILWDPKNTYSEAALEKE